jgi:hypothetical protein
VLEKYLSQAMARLVLRLSDIVFLQITPSYRGRQLNAEGIRRMQMDRAAEAEVQFRQGIQADPKMPRQSPTSAGAVQTGKIRRKHSIFRTGSRQPPAGCSGPQRLAQAYIRVHRPHDAAAVMAQACLDPNNPA